MGKNNELLDELVAAQNKSFKCAAFSGGGAKGAIYSGAHEAMASSGVLDGLEAVAGSSAGAITAAVIATGISTEDFKRLSSETNLPNLLGKGVVINKDGKPLYQLMKDTTSNNILKYFEANDIMEVCGRQKEVLDLEIGRLLEKGNPEDLAEVEALQQKRDRLESIIAHDGQELFDIQERIKNNGTVYFRDLDIMHLIDPVKFKDLVITVTNKETGELTIFDARKTPYVEIALACRASASIPIVFEPVEIDGVQYVDGGYRDNIPMDHFEEAGDKSIEAEDISDSPDKVKAAQKQGRTLSLAFGSDGMDSSAHVAVYSAKEKIIDPSRLMKFLMDVVFKVLNGVGGKFKYSESEEKNYQGLRENALNTVILDTKDVGTLSFKEAQEKAEYLHIKGAIQTTRHFENHGIGSHEDPNLARKEFLLQVYEETQEKGIVSKWKDKILGGKEEKLGELLQFCKDDAWKGKDADSVIADFVEVASTARSDGSLTVNTRTMTKMVSMLNDPTTPSSVKEDFVKALGVDIKQEAGQSRDEALVKFKFEPKHFENIVKEKSAKKPNKTSFVNKTGGTKRKREDVVKRTLKKARKSSKSDQVIDELKARESQKKGR